MENSYLKWETLLGSCNTKLCSLLKQRQTLDDFLQDVPPRSQFEEFKAQKRAPGMEFLGKRSPYLQHHRIPMVEKRAPGIKNIKIIIINIIILSKVWNFLEKGQWTILMKFSHMMTIYSKFVRLWLLTISPKDLTPIYT